MPVPSEDKAIMLERARLERYWASNLTLASKSNWLARWSARPPHDAYGRVYTPFARTSQSQTQRPPATIYALGHKFSATYRLALAPASTPARPAETTIEIKFVQSTTQSIQIQVTNIIPSTVNPPILIYISGVPPPMATAFYKYTSYLGAELSASIGDIVDLTAAWQVRNTPTVGGQVYARAIALNEDNMLSTVPSLISATLTAA